MAEKVVRKELCKEFCELREELTLVRKFLEKGTKDAIKVAKSGLDSVLYSRLDKIEELLVPTSRERALKTLKKADGSIVLTADVWEDVMARLTVEEIMQKYEIKSLTTFYKHIRASKELEGERSDKAFLKRAKKDKEYAQAVLKRLKASKERF